MIETIFTEKYRPRRLDEIVGQRDIVRRLKAYVQSKNMPNLLFSGPRGSGKTTCALCLAQEIYGSAWLGSFKELNSSDERGIDIVRGKIKEFASSRSLGGEGFKILLLDEMDALTKDAQNALRRTMEVYTNSCRFILTCNYLSKVIDPIVSRCNLYRFSRLSNDEIIGRLRQICILEGILYEEGALDAICFVSEGDLRKAIGLLDLEKEEITVHDIYVFSQYVKPEIIKDLIEKLLNREFFSSFTLIENLLLDGIDTRHILRQMLSEVVNLNMDDRVKLTIIELIGEAEFRIAEGADEMIQMKAFLASIMNKLTWM